MEEIPTEENRSTVRSLLQKFTHGSFIQSHPSLKPLLSDGQDTESTCWTQHFLPHPILSEEGIDRLKLSCKGRQGKGKKQTCSIQMVSSAPRLRSQRVAPKKFISGHVFLEEIVYTIVVVSGRPSGEGIGYPLHCSWATLVAQLVKNLPAMQETWVQSLCWEGSLEKGMATYFSILAWRIPCML